MKLGFLLVLFFPLLGQAQLPAVQKIIQDLSALNEEVVRKGCNNDTSMIVTHRGLNLFFANKIGSYLSGSGDISLYRNYAIMNTTGGEFSINHNFRKEKQSGSLPPMTTLGFKARFSDGFASIFSNEQLNSDVGILIKRTWFGRGITYFGACAAKVNGKKDTRPTQKAMMNSKRSFILHKLEIEMIKEANEFESILEKMKASEFENESELLPAKQELRESFYYNLRKEYEYRFAEQEAKALSEDSSYAMINTSWFTVMAYLPVTAQRFSITPSFSEDFANEQLFPWKINLNYSEIIEKRNIGRFIIFFDGGLFNNNSVHTRTVSKLKLLEYKNRGGTDTLHFAELKIKEAWIGTYKSFITPYIKLQVVWFPLRSNAGASFLFEKNFGNYHPMNVKLGAPIRFNDKNGEPSVNFEFQLRAFDLSNTLNSNRKLGKKLSVGFSVGLPFSGGL